MAQSNKRTRLFIEFAAKTFFVGAVNTRHIYQHVDQLRAYLVVHHVDRLAVCSDVDLTNHIEQEGFLDVGSAYQCIHHHADELDLWQKFLNYFRQVFIDRMVINACQVVGHLSFAFEIVQQLHHIRLNLC